MTDHDTADREMIARLRRLARMPVLRVPFVNAKDDRLDAECLRDAACALARRIAEVDRLRALVRLSGLWKTAPCCLCGYNGPLYFDSAVHPCALSATTEDQHAG